MEESWSQNTWLSQPETACCDISHCALHEAEIRALQYCGAWHVDPGIKPTPSSYIKSPCLQAMHRSIAARGGCAWLDGRLLRDAEHMGGDGGQ